MEDASLQLALNRLTEADILLVQGVPPNSDYRFKHALIQNAAYENLLKSRRQLLHRRSAELLRDQFAKGGVAEPELLAHHFTQAGLTEAAIEWWDKAGQRSLARSAMVEAEALLRKGLALVPQLADSVSRQEHELDLQIALGLVLSQIHGFHTQAPRDAYSRARQLCDELKRPQKILPVLYGQWVNSFVGADLKRAEQFAAEMLSLGEQTDDVVTRVVGYRASGATSLFHGDFAMARASLLQGISLYDPAQRALYRNLTSVDTHVALMSYVAPALACCGQLDRARSCCDETLAEARNSSHAPTLAHMLWAAWWTGWCARSEPSMLLLCADELVALSANRELAFWHKIGLMFRGWCLAALDRGQEAMLLMTAGLPDLRSTCVGTHVLTMMADAFRLIGQPEIGLTHLKSADQQAKATQVEWCQSETLRMRGVLLTLTGDCVGAEVAFNDAITLAQQQDAKFFELRAALDLARLWRDQGKRQEARELLAPVYGRFTEGFDTLNLKEAKALLDELAA
jgi:predicted ATPase